MNHIPQTEESVNFFGVKTVPEGTFEESYKRYTFFIEYDLYYTFEEAIRPKKNLRTETGGIKKRGYKTHIFNQYLDDYLKNHDQSYFNQLKPFDNVMEATRPCTFYLRLDLAERLNTVLEKLKNQVGRNKGMVTSLINDMFGNMIEAESASLQTDVTCYDLVVSVGHKGNESITRVLEVACNRPLTDTLLTDLLDHTNTQLVETEEIKEFILRKKNPTT